jgi:hypothetical protein
MYYPHGGTDDYMASFDDPDVAAAYYIEAVKNRGFGMHEFIMLIIIDETRDNPFITTHLMDKMSGKFMAVSDE